MFLSLYHYCSPYFRKKRFETFLLNVKPSVNDQILDLGGRPVTWVAQEPVGESVELVNINAQNLCPDEYPGHSISSVEGNGCDLEYEDASFAILFSNSTIEHVHSWENQQRFAAECRRVGKALWIQTPAREFFMEPHYLTPFIHWFSKPVQKKLLRNFSVWGLLMRPDEAMVDEKIAEHRLLTLAEVEELFPDCEILREKFLGIFTKSYIAFRPQQGQKEMVAAEKGAAVTLASLENKPMASGL